MPQPRRIDAQGKILGRLASEVALIIRGKNKPGFTYNQDHGERVVVTNADKVRVSGNKLEAKQYYHHSSYPGGLKSKSLKELLSTKPEEVIYRAVRGMLPDNRLRNIWLKKLTIECSTDD